GFLMVVNPSVTWLRLSASAGTAPATINVVGDPTGLPVGTYQTSLQVFSGTSLSAVVPVTFTVSSLAINPNSISFSYQTGGAVPPAQSVTLTSTTTTNFTASASTSTGNNWLQVTPASGVTPGSVSAQLNSAVVPTLPAGTYSGSITITPVGSSASG